MATATPLRSRPSPYYSPALSRAGESSIPEPQQHWDGKDYDDDDENDGDDAYSEGDGAVEEKDTWDCEVEPWGHEVME